jgi:hypothetical protein
MVLMCLCDFANDEGEHCWPSVATIGRKCSKGDRTIQAALKSLCELGYLTINERAGTSSQYHLDPRKICAPAKSAPPQKTAPTPAKSAPKPPRTTINGLASAKPMRAKNWPELPDWIPAAPWNAYHEMRKQKRAKATPRAVELLLADLSKWRARGHDPGVILDASVVNNWTGIFEPKERGNGNDIRRSGAAGTDKRSGLARAIDSELGSLSAFP